MDGLPQELAHVIPSLKLLRKRLLPKLTGSFWRLHPLVEPGSMTLLTPEMIDGIREKILPESGNSDRRSGSAVCFRIDSLSPCRLVSQEQLRGELVPNPKDLRSDGYD